MVSITARRRYRLAHRSLMTRGDLADLRQCGLPFAALAGSGLTVGLLALVFVLGSFG
jgi:putative membrane protein